MSDELLFQGISDDGVIEKEKKRLEEIYKYIFSSDMGLEVLGDVLINFCHFGCFLGNPDEVAQYNVGVQILSRLGAFSKGNTEKVIKGLINSLPNKEE